ncbi:DUF397 domain-containing protein [Kitasatospora sp. NPDC003701]
MFVDLTGARWCKSSHSQQGGDCIEMAPGIPGFAPVRDSKDPQGPALIFPAEAWQAFIAGVQSGEFGAV